MPSLPHHRSGQNRGCQVDNAAVYFLDLQDVHYEAWATKWASVLKMSLYKGFVKGWNDYKFTADEGGSERAQSET